MDARRQWLLGAMRAIADHFHAEELPIAITVMCQNDEGMIITYTVSIATQGSVIRSAVVDPEKLVASTDGAFIALEHGEI